MNRLIHENYKNEHTEILQQYTKKHSSKGK